MISFYGKGVSVS